MLDKNKLKEQQYIEKLGKIINKLILKSKKFCNLYCVPDGLATILQLLKYDVDRSESVTNLSSFSNDFDYYSFAKSTKTLCAIRHLLKDTEYHFNEDILILVRSIFENHIMSRYFREKIDQDDKDKSKLVNDFIQNPLKVTKEYYHLDGFRILNNNGDKVGAINKISNYKLGLDKEYYKEFYHYLSEYSHCSFGNIDLYLGNTCFVYDINKNKLESILFAVFVFTKVVEGVATVEGENYYSYKEEKSYFDLVYDSLELQIEIFDYLITNNLNKYDEKATSNLYIIDDILSEQQKCENQLRMLSKMKDSIYEELGSLKKIKSGEGRFIRNYPKYN